MAVSTDKKILLALATCDKTGQDALFESLDLALEDPQGAIPSLAARIRDLALFRLAIKIPTKTLDPYYTEATAVGNASALTAIYLAHLRLTNSKALFNIFDTPQQGRFLDWIAKSQLPSNTRTLLRTYIAKAFHPTYRGKSAAPLPVTLRLASPFCDLHTSGDSPWALASPGTCRDYCPSDFVYFSTYSMLPAGRTPGLFTFTEALLILQTCSLTVREGDIYYPATNPPALHFEEQMEVTLRELARVAIENYRTFTDNVVSLPQVPSLFPAPSVLIPAAPAPPAIATTAPALPAVVPTDPAPIVAVPATTPNPLTPAAVRAPIPYKTITENEWLTEVPPLPSDIPACMCTICYTDCHPPPGTKRISARTPLCPTFRLNYTCCDLSCHASSCHNRFDQADTVPVQVYNTGNPALGWGLRPAPDTSAAPLSYVGEYLGEVIDQEEAARRLSSAKRNKLQCGYMMEMSTTETPNNVLVVDARSQGGDTRFINHSCVPNCRASVFLSHDGPHLRIQTTKAVTYPEPFTLDYRQVDGSIFQKSSCYCGASACKRPALVPVTTRSISRLSPPEQQEAPRLLERESETDSESIDSGRSSPTEPASRRSTRFPGTQIPRSVIATRPLVITTLKALPPDSSLLPSIVARPVSVIPCNVPTDPPRATCTLSPTAIDVTSPHRNKNKKQTAPTE